jgi:hypothetical protein
MTNLLIFWLFLCTFLPNDVWAGVYSPAETQSQDITFGNVVVRGTLVCIDPEAHVTPCTGKEDSCGLKDPSGRVYPLQSDKSLETLRTEPQIRSNEFQLTLRQIPKSTLYGIIKPRFIRDGKLYEFYYYCDVCNITTYHPGPCMCCQQETVYHEKKVEEK